MYYNPEDTPLYISEYSLLAFGDKHLLHMLIYWDSQLWLCIRINENSTELTYIVCWDI